jgi:hypothetical protein
MNDRAGKPDSKREKEKDDFKDDVNSPRTPGALRVFDWFLGSKNPFCDLRTNLRELVQISILIRRNTDAKRLR